MTDETVLEVGGLYRFQGSGELPLAALDNPQPDVELLAVNERAVKVKSLGSTQFPFGKIAVFERDAFTTRWRRIELLEAAARRSVDAGRIPPIDNPDPRVKPEVYQLLPRLYFSQKVTASKLGAEAVAAAARELHRMHLADPGGRWFSTRESLPEGEYVACQLCQIMALRSVHAALAAEGWLEPGEPT